MAYLETNQEIYDSVMNHLWKQNCQSIKDLGLCLYRGPGKRKCAVGHLIPNETYDSEMEEKDIRELLTWLRYHPEEKFVELFKFLYKNYYILMELQQIHDGYLPPYFTYNGVEGNENSFREYVVSAGTYLAGELNLVPFVPPVVEVTNTV